MTVGNSPVLEGDQDRSLALRPGDGFESTHGPIAAGWEPLVRLAISASFIGTAIATFGGWYWAVMRLLGAD